MSDTTIYRLVADPSITAYQLAQIIAGQTYWVSKESYDALPVDVQAYFVPIVVSPKDNEPE